MRSAITFGLITMLQLVLVQMGKAQSATINQEQLRGLVYPSRQVELSAPLRGVLKMVMVEEGDSVKSGDVLVKMDDALPQISVAGARMAAESNLEIEAAWLEFELAKLEHERIEKIFQNNGATEWEVRKRKAERDLAMVRHKHAQQRKQLAQNKLELEQQNLARYTLKAPFDGQIHRIIVEAGATLTEADKILVLYSLDPLEARMFLPTTLHRKLEQGRVYQLAAKIPDQPEPIELFGTLKTVDAVIDPASETIRSVFTIENPGKQLPSGFTVVLRWPQEPMAFNKVPAAVSCAGDGT